MTPYGWTWVAVIAASVLALVTKLVGHLLPESWLEHPRVHRICALITVGLLGALFSTQAFTSGDVIVLDARVVSVAVAAVLLWKRAPFILVVVSAAAVAAGLRLLGFP